MNQNYEQANSVREFILKLARDPGLKESDAIEAIVNQLTRIEQSPYFTRIMDDLDPDSFGADIKGLDDRGRGILRSAQDIYIGRQPGN